MHIAKSLRAERAQLVADARAIITTDNPTADDNARFDAMMAKADSLKAQIDRVEKAASLEAELAESRGISAEKRGVSVAQIEDEAAREGRVFNAYVRGGMQGVPDADRAFAMSRFNAAQTTGTGSSGGYTVAPEFQRELQLGLKAYGGMREVSRVISTNTGATLTIPTMDDTANVGEIIAENAAQNQQDLAFGQTSLGAYTYSSKMILVPIQLIQDSAFDVGGLIRDALVTRLGRITNTHFTTGDGSSKPSGVITGAALGATGASGQTTSVIYDDLVNLVHSVDPALRRNAVFMMHDSTVKALKKLSDSTDRPLWVPGVAVNEPDTLCGYRYVVNQDMPVMAAGAKSILFGDFSHFWIREVSGVQLRRLEERYAEYLQVAFFGYGRWDSKLISASAPIKWYANAAS